MAVSVGNDVYKYIDDTGEPEGSQLVTTYPHHSLITDPLVPRLQVDNGSTGFFAGKEFRFFLEFNIANTQSAWIKVVAPIDITLKLQFLEVDTGGVRFRAFRDATEIGPFVAPSSPTSGWFNRNQPAADEFGYTGVTVVTVGGDGAVDADGTVTEIIRLITAGATAQRTSVGATGIQERGVPAGTYHLQLENIASSGATTGVYGFVIEERLD